MGKQNVGKSRVRPVTQAEMAAFVRLREVVQKRDALRADLRDRLLAGAAVEPGLLTARVQVRSQQNLSWAILTDAVGEVEAARIREGVEPRETAFLYVTPTSVAKLKQSSGVAKVRPAWNKFAAELGEE